MKRIIAFLLVLCIAVSLVACGKPAENLQNTQELDRQDKELLAELVGGQDAEDLTDEELDELVDQLIQNTDTESVSGVVNLSDKKKPENGFTPESDAYDENGAIKEPFDQVYPELIEKEEVVFSGESILIKLASDKLTEGLKKAGVGALEKIVPMGEVAWYEAKLTEGTDAQKALEAVRKLSEVLLAEYNYEVQVAAIDDYKHFDKDKDEEFKKNGHNKDQWHFHHCGIPDGYEEMETEGGDRSVVVAVIDTGVDYNHEDLKDNMWVNAKEIPDNGRDDDGNGYIDDYYGVDITAGKGNGDDTNGHGTHVAGIIAARNNNTGVLGIAYNVKIMSVKAAMHSGVLNQADIAKAVLYAYENGAEVINMSFGGTASSIAVQDALETAYTRCVLVASAGNSGKPNENSDFSAALPNYPAALTYVLGVMSVDETGKESLFTNWDCYAYNGVEYELYAPGENIMSTLPGNRYGYLSGTSMAAPVVSGIAAILRSEFSDRDKYPTKFIYGQLASTSGYTADCVNPGMHTVDGVMHNLPQIVNLNDALTKLPKPDVNLQNYTIFDDPKYSAKNNGDGVIDAGETIAVGFTLRNRWGMSKNTVVTVDTISETSGLADPYITIHNATVNYGSVGTYSTGDCGKVYTDGLFTGWENPFLITISEDCPNDYRFSLKVTISCENALDEADTTIYVEKGGVMEAVRSGYILPSVIDKDMTLTKDNLYIIPNSTVIQKGVTVRVEPGTHIQFWSNDAGDPYKSNYIAYLLVNGKLFVEGTKEEPVYIYPSQLMDHYGVEIGASSTGYISMKYADVTNLFCYPYDNNTGTQNKINKAEHCTFRVNYDDALRYRKLSGGSVGDYSLNGYIIGNIDAKDSVFYKIGYDYSITLGGAMERCIFVDCGIAFAGPLRDCVFQGKGNHFTNSKSVTTGSAAPSVEKVVYRPETGTTYVVGDASALLAELADMQYAVIETQDEQDWLKANIDSFCEYKMGIAYNGYGYVWSDGTAIGSFIDGDGMAQADPGKELVWYPYTGKLKEKSTAAITTKYTLFEQPGHILPTEIIFREYEVDIDSDTTYQITPLSKPVQLPVDAFLYESCDESVLKVSATGVVTPVGNGTANVYVYSKDKAVSNYVTINVVDYVPLESAAFPVESLRLACGATAYAGCTLTPANTTRKNVTYTSSDESIAKVDVAGNVTGVGFGNAVITARIENFVLRLPVEVCLDSLSFNGEILVAEGEKTAIGCITDPVGMDPTMLQYASSDASIAKVDADGNVTGIKPGTATITASYGEMTAQTTVKVYKKAIKVSVESLDMTIAMDAEPVATPDNQVKSNYKYEEDNNAEVDLKWSVADENIAKIEDGKIVPVGVGTTTLMVTDSRSGQSDAIALYVTERALAKAKEIFPVMSPGYTEDCQWMFYVLLEDGQLYEVKCDYRDRITKALRFENVKDFDCGGSAQIILFNDDTVKVIDQEAEWNGYDNMVGDISYFVGRAPVKVACYTGQYYVITEENYAENAYAWGFNNENYQLGVWEYGDYSNYPVYSPTYMYSVSGEHVTDIVAVRGMTLVCAGYGDYDEVFVLGGEWLQQQDAKRISYNVKCLNRLYNENGSSAVAYMAYDEDSGCDYYYSFNTEDASPVKGNSYSCWESVSVGENIVLNSDWDFSNGEEHKLLACEWRDGGQSRWRIRDVAAARLDDRYAWIIDESGTIFQMATGYNYYTSYWAPDIITSFPLGENGPEDPYYRLVSTNLSEDGVLSGTTLELTFDKVLYMAEDYSAYDWSFYRKTNGANGWSNADGAAKVKVRGNVVTVTFTSLSSEYQYNFGIGWVNGANGTTRAEEMDVYFTYQKAATIVPDQGGAPEEAPEVSHPSVLDPTISRIPTKESIQEKLTKLQAETQSNSNFYGNAILNPITTDTKVENWFRLQAPSVTAGTYKEIPLGSNYWGTDNTRAIELQMIDYTDFISYARFMYAPYKTVAPENTFPFVTGVTLLNKYGEEVTTVGNEEITIRVTFNRDMDTSIPLVVRFGSSAPYGDYEVAGQYVNARTWEGVYTVKSVIANGNQRFTISGGCSATEDLELQPDSGRFGFVIDTTAAQALIMQGTATDTGIELKWTQDDFDTLMGYNVYRSTKEDGQYTRLNKTVIPADTMTFFDDTVEPGKVYYYNFTVVQTDLSESEPSGKIVIMSKDTMAPNIYHSPVAEAFTGANLVLSATITDNLNIAYANLYYRVAGTENWNIIRMNKLNDKYSAIIPAQYMTVAGVEYYIEAFDGVSATFKGSAEAPYTILVQEAVDENALGDVDGDGVITNLDALKLLYAINDKYNMTAEEFARADLNGDGELWAAEALRILQYVSGVVGSVKM